MSQEKKLNPENSKALRVQKCLATDDGKVLYELLVKYCKPDVVQLPLDTLGRIDSLMVQQNEGKRSVMLYIDSLKNKDLSKVKQESAKV